MSQPRGGQPWYPTTQSESGRWVVAEDADCAELGGGQGGAHGLGAARPSAAGCSQGAAETWRAAQAATHRENIPAQVPKPFPEEGWRSGRSEAGASCTPLPTPPAAFLAAGGCSCQFGVLGAVKQRAARCSGFNGLCIMHVYKAVKGSPANGGRGRQVIPMAGCGLELSFPISAEQRGVKHSPKGKSSQAGGVHSMQPAPNPPAKPRSALRCQGGVGESKPSPFGDHGVRKSDKMLPKHGHQPPQTCWVPGSRAEEPPQP